MLSQSSGGGVQDGRRVRKDMHGLPSENLIRTSHAFDAEEPSLQRNVGGTISGGKNVSLRGYSIVMAS
jgi:hypothetical protein